MLLANLWVDLVLQEDIVSRGPSVLNRVLKALIKMLLVPDQRKIVSLVPLVFIVLTRRLPHPQGTVNPGTIARVGPLPSFKTHVRRVTRVLARTLRLSPVKLGRIKVKKRKLLVIHVSPGSIVTTKQ